MEPEMGDEMVRQLQFAGGAVGWLWRFCQKVRGIQRARQRNLYDRVLEEQQRADAVDMAGRPAQQPRQVARVVRRYR